MSLPASTVTVERAGASCTVVCGDSREELKAYRGQVDLAVTSPPYADARQRHYDSVHPDDFAAWFMTFHQSLWDALKPSGSLVINIKDKVVGGVRHRYVWHTIEALTAAGWYCIEDYLWHKTNPMPGYWPTRLRDGWEYCFHLSKSKRPYMNQDAVRRPVGDWVETRLVKLGEHDRSRQNSANASGFGRDISRWVDKPTVLPPNVLSLPLVGRNTGHPAVFPVDLPLFFIRLLCPVGGLVIDPFGGSGTTGLAALSAGRRSVLIDNNEDYCLAAVKRLREESTSHHHEQLAEQNLFPLVPIKRKGRRGRVK